MTEFTRTFHPVGQGAFYSETFRIKMESKKDTAYRVVYDCGSKKDKQWLKSRVSGAFPDNNIDILFLSHFHDDHYKGIENLNPKTIVIPLLDEWDKVIFWIGKNLGKCSIDVNYAAKLKEKFSNSRFIYIRALDEESRRTEEPTNIDNLFTNAYGTEDSVHDITFPSGIWLKANAIPDWIYIPVNPKLDNSVTDRFKTLLADKGIDWEKLKKLDNQYFLEHKKTLAKIYKDIGDPNEFSIAVYSGPNPYKLRKVKRPIRLERLKIGNVYRNCICYEPVSSWCIHHCPNFIENCRLHSHIKSGCLYLGDINLSNDSNDLHSSLLQKLYSLFPIECIQEIGTIQVPHHGSIDNYHSSLKSYYDWTVGSWEELHGEIFYVISVGESNNYGHPSAWVIKDLLDFDRTVVLVTETAGSIFIEKTRW